MPIYLYILKRLLVAIPTLFLVSIISFSIMRYDISLGPLAWGKKPHQTVIFPAIRFKSPIDPLAELKQNPQISKAALQHETERLGLDKPFWTQYWLWLTHMLNVDWSALRQGRFWAFYQPDFGKSFAGEDVTTLLAQRIPNTLLLNVIALVVNWFIAIPLGVYAALRWRTKWDSGLTVFSSVGMAAPGFVVAVVLAAVCVKTGLLPYGGLVSDGFEELNWFQKLGDISAHLVIPVFVLSFAGIAGLQRQMRGNLLDVLEAEYVRTARAKGLPENKVIYKHAVRTAINPLITLMGFELAALLSGSAIIEMVLRYPGLGFLIYEGVRQTDTNLVMTSLLMGTLLLILGNLAADIFLKVADPRIELQ